MSIDRRPFFDRHRESRMETEREWRGKEPRFAVSRGDTWDFMPDKEVHKKFIRICYDVDVQGALTPDELDRRLKDAAEMLRFLGKRGYVDAERANRNANNLEKVVGTGFSPRVISIAKTHPYGIINLTLNYGPKEAVRRTMEREKRLREMLRTRR